MGASEGKAVSSAPDGFLVSHEQDDTNLAPHLISLLWPTSLIVKQKLWSWSGDDFRVKDENGNHQLSVSGTVWSVRAWTLITDASGRGIAVCIRKVWSLRSTYFVYGFTPREAGQLPSGEQHEGADLYAWAKVEKPMFECTTRPSLIASMATVGGNWYPEAYTMKPVAWYSPKLEITKKGKGCCFVDRSLFQLEGNNCYHLNIAPGIDPALMVCFVIIKDELLEASS